MHKLKSKEKDRRRKLPRPIRLKHGKPLVLLSDCRTYVLNLEDGEQSQDKWQRAAELMFAAATGGNIDEVVGQFARILIHQNNLVLGSFPRSAIS